MSFGFGVGDFAGILQLSWTLYRYCYKVARDAPEDFKLLLGEITMLSQSIRLLEEEASDPDSTMVRAGEDRVRMVKEMIVRVEVTLKELQKHAAKYDKLGDVKLSKRKQIWSKFKWSTDATELDALRNKLVYHNGVISLLLNSFGNSSLKQIDATTVRLERRLSEIGAIVIKFGAGDTQQTPAISATDDSPSGMTFISSIFIKNAEIGNRRWASIGVDEWIQAGKWWLMKSQMELAGGSSSNVASSQQGYINLIKASWILIDVIARHPQLNLLDSGIRYDVELLANTIQRELESVEAQGISKPGPAILLTHDLDIWVSQAKGPALKPTIGEGEGNRSWALPDEELLFQRFGLHHSHNHATKTPCIVLLLMHKTEKKARIILGNQSWTILEEFTLGTTSTVTSENFMHIGEQKIELLTALDATHLFSLWGAVEEYLLRYKRETQDLVLLRCLTLLVSMKNNHDACAERLIEDEPDFDTSTRSVLYQRLWLASTEAVPRIRRRREILSLDISSDHIDRRLFSWVTERGHETLTRLLLAVFDITVGEEIAVWLSLKVAAESGHVAALAFHLSELGMNDTALARWGPQLVERAAAREDLIVLDMLLNVGTILVGSRVLASACLSGHDAVVNCFLQAGVDVNQDDALADAAMFGQEIIVDLLLQNGARPHSNCLGDAIGRGYESIVDKFLQAGAVIEPNHLKDAIEAGLERIVDKILQSGAKFPLADAAKVAISKKNEVMFDKLLKAGANAAEDGFLSCAINYRQEAIVHKLLQAGADAGADIKGEPLLSKAAGSGHRGIVNLLVQAGADHMIDDALDVAAREGYEEIVDILLEAGADINACAALANAVRYGHKSIVEKLLRAGAIVSTGNVDSAPLINAMGQRDEALVVMLLKAGASLGPFVRSNSLTDLQSRIDQWDPTLVDLVLQEFAEDKPVRG